MSVFLGLVSCGGGWHVEASAYHLACCLSRRRYQRDWAGLGRETGDLSVWRSVGLMDGVKGVDFCWVPRPASKAFPGWGAAAGGAAN
jgi:hypothetical protein